MRWRIKILVALFIVIILLGSYIVVAKQCEMSVLKPSLRKALFAYFRNPASSELSAAELRDLLNFYLDIQAGRKVINCNTKGDETKIKMQDILDKTDAVEVVIPTCSDGTEYGDCSLSKPQYCFNGQLTDKCSACGCAMGMNCSATEQCVKAIS